MSRLYDSKNGTSKVDYDRLLLELHFMQFYLAYLGNLGHAALPSIQLNN